MISVPIPDNPLIVAGARWIGAPLSKPAEDQGVDRWVEEINQGTNFYFNLLDTEAIEDGRARFFIDSLLRELKPALYLRHAFEVGTDLESAVLHSCGLGWHEVSCNGERVDDRRFDPRRSDYRERSFYVTRDITLFLHEGKNALGVLLADGWYGQSVAFCEPGYTYRYGDPGLIAALHLTYKDGTEDWLLTDRSWRWASSPILKSNIYTGEYYDARCEIKGWAEPEFNDEEWERAQYLAPRSPRLFPMKVPPERTAEPQQAERIRKLADGDWLFDFGVNTASLPQLYLRKASLGQRVRLRYCQNLDETGMPNYASMGGHVSGVLETDVFVSASVGEVEWQPRFAFHGFRYAVVSGLEETAQEDTLMAVPVHTDLPVRGHFESDNELLNKIDAVMERTQQSLLHGTADAMAGRERDAYICQALFNGRHLYYRFGSQVFWREMLVDFTTNRLPGGMPADISPGNRREIVPGDMINGVRDFTLAPAITTHWDYYLYTGDIQPLEAHYTILCDYLSYFPMQAKKPGSHIIRGLGDWLDSRRGKDEKAEGVDGPTVFQTSTYITGTTLYAYAARSMAQIATVLNRAEDSAKFNQLADAIAEELRQCYYDNDAKTFGSQAGDAMGIIYGVIPESDHSKVLGNIVRDIHENHNGHLSTGFFGTYPLLHLLSTQGLGALAVDLMTQTTYPSYGDMITNYDGPELLEGWRDYKKRGAWKMGRLQMEMATGGEWFFRDLAGISPDPAQPGFRHFFLRPTGYQKLKKAGATIQSPQGEISSFWEVSERQFHWHVVIPDGASATVTLPADEWTYRTQQSKESNQKQGPQVLSSGEYKLTCLIPDYTKL